nr:unnamed protein product [Spirometra erinaceieuropaei]
MYFYAFVGFYGSLFLCFQSVDSAVFDFQIMQNGSSCFEVRWRTNMAIDKTKEFRLAVNDHLDSSCKKIVEEGNFSCTINDTEANTNYKCQLFICPLNSVSTTKCSPESKAVDVCTAPKAAQSLTGKVWDNETVEVTWQTPQQNAEGLLTYVILRGTDAPRPVVNESKIGSNSVNFTNLNALTSYNATVDIYSKLSITWAFSETVLTLTTFPNAPVNITILGVGRNWIKVFVQPLPGGDVYNLNYNVRADSPSKPLRECTARDSSEGPVCTIEGLASGTKYSIAAQACLQNGCSVFSSEIFGETKKLLSAGDIVAIVLGVLFGILLVIFIAYLCYVKHKGGSGYFAPDTRRESYMKYRRTPEPINSYLQ